MDVSRARTIPTWYDKHIIVSISHVLIEHEFLVQITSTYPESVDISAALSLTPFTVLPY